MKTLIAFTFTIFSLFSCIVGEGKNEPLLNPSTEKGDTLTRRSLKESDRKKQGLCREMGTQRCEGDRECEGICETLFTNLLDKRKCFKLPLELVQGFQNLLELVVEGDNFREIELPVLECLLDIDEKPLALKIGRLNRESSEDFLSFTAQNKDLGDIMDTEDDEHLLLRRLYNNLSFESEELKNLRLPIDGRSHLLELIAIEENQKAWNWVESFIEEECKTSTICEANQGYNSSIVFYCRLFLGTERGRLRSIMKSSLFEKHIGREIEGKNVCGANKNEECDSRYRDHFTDFCASYTSEISL